MSIGTKVDDHVADGLSLLISRFADKERFRDFVAAFLRPKQDLEDALWDVVTKFGLVEVVDGQGFAEGVFLDAIGKIVGEAREGLADAAYVLRLRARIATNRSNGTIPELSGILRLLLPASKHEGIRLQGMPLKSLDVVIPHVLTPGELSAVLRFLIDAIDAEVEALVGSYGADDSCFEFASTYNEDTIGEEAAIGEGWGIESVPASGGTLGHAQYPGSYVRTLPVITGALAPLAWYRADNYNPATGVLTDLSGNGLDGLAPSGNRPALETLEGQATMAFGALEYFDIPGILDEANAPLNVFIVSQFEELEDSQTLFDLTSNTGETFGGHTLFFDAGGAGAMSYRVGPPPIEAAVDFGYDDLAFRVFRSQHRQDFRQLDRDGVKISFGDQTDDKPTPAMTQGRIGMLARTAGGLGLTGWISEILFFGELTDSDVAAIYSYLSDRYNKVLP